MGNSKSRKNKDEEYDAKMKNTMTDNHIVLLGTGQSGKSTIFRQLESIYTQTTISERWRRNHPPFKGRIRLNMANTINLTLRFLATACDRGDKNCNLSSLGLFNDEQKTDFESYFRTLFTNAWHFRSDIELPEIRQELHDIVQNQLPKVKQAMKARLSEIFDLNKLSDCIQLLLTYSPQYFFDRFDDSVKIDVSEWDARLDHSDKIDMFTATTAEMKDYCHRIFDMINHSCTERCLDNAESYGEALHKIWNELEAFRYVYSNLGETAGFEENFIANMDYYFDKCLEVFGKSFVASDEDLLRMNMRTTGYQERKFDIDGKMVLITDTGGQRSERKKWYLTADCDTVVFVSALDHFRLKIWEDSQTNGMQESLNCFEQIISNEMWNKKKIILILNREDLFRQSLKQGHRLSLCFGNEYKKMNCSREFDIKIITQLMFKHLGYDKSVTIPIEIVNIIYYFLDCEFSLKFAYENGIEFIKQRFLSLNCDTNRKISIFVVNAIMQTEVETVMGQIL